MEKEQKPKKQRGSDFVRQTALALLIFLLLTSAYSYVAEQNSTRKEIALSALAADVTKGNIEELIVRGDEIEVRYKNRDEKNPSYTFAKKEVSGTLAKTL